MSLAPGTRLGPYELLSLAGAGGMGEVYKATDTRLDRTVAVKILPPHAASHDDLKQRFEREAQTIGNLNHPNICVLHDIGHERPRPARDAEREAPGVGPRRTDESGLGAAIEDPATDFIVMEYLEGRTLADRLASAPARTVAAAAAASVEGTPAGSGAPPPTQTSRPPKSGPGTRGLKLDEALGIALQIADALDKAHQQGVVHRDLKPGNVMLLSGAGSRPGVPHVKLLDFGLAKLTAPTAAVESALTVRADLTQPGMILGTMSYMAPEQVEGQEADTRTDVFAFGALLYEMLTGRRAFEGKSQASLIAAIMHGEPPPLAMLVPMTPASLDRLVRRCLAKDPDDRWQTVHDLLIQLRWITGGRNRAGAPSQENRRRREPLVVAALALAVLVTAGAAVPAFRYFNGTPPADPFSFRVPAFGLNPLDVALSPDGTTIALVSSADGPGALYIRPVGAIAFRKLAGTENAAQPFWSPDGRWIAFVAGGRLKKVEASGTPPQDLGAVDGFFGGTWSPSGTILFGSAKGLRRISAEGGVAESVTTLEASEIGHYWPACLPDGERYLFLAWSADPDKREIVAGSLGSAERTRLVAASSNPGYAPSPASGSAPGYLLYRRDATLLAQPFDPRRLALSGAPVQVAGEVAFNVQDGRSAFSASADSLIFFQSGGAGGSVAQVTADWQFGFHDRSGKLSALAGEAGTYGDMDLSPDGRLLAVTRQEAGASSADIWILDTERNVRTRLTLDGADDVGPVWSPDGRKVAFTSLRKGNADIYVKLASGVADETPLLESPADEYVEDWSKDGRFIAYRRIEGGRTDLYVVPLDEQGKPGEPFPVVTGPYDKDEPQFSFDGQWLTYVSDETGTFEVYVVSFPGLDRRFKISDGGGGRPRWRQDGREIYYTRLLGGPMFVDFAPDSRTPVSPPRVLWNSPGRGGTDPRRHLFEAAPDGQQFVIRTVAATGVASGVTPSVAARGITMPLTFAPDSQPAPGQPSAGGRGAAATGTTLAASPANGLTVVRHWTTTVEKAGAR